MDRSKIWLLGLLPITGLWAWTAATHNTLVEQDLTQRAGSALSTVSLDTLDFHFNGRDATLAGNTSKSANVTAAAHILYSTYGVRLVNSIIKSSPSTVSYNFEINKQDNSVTVSGNVPVSNQSKAMIDTVKMALPSDKVRDELTYTESDHDSKKLASVMSFVASLLPDLSTGVVSVDDDVLSIIGQVKDQKVLDRLMVHLKTLPKKLMTLGEVKLNLLDVQVKENLKGLIFRAEYHAARNILILDGFYKDNEQHQSILKAAHRSFQTEKIVDNLVLEDTTPSVLTKIVDLSLSQLLRFDNAIVQLKDEVLSLSGNSLYGKKANDHIGSILRAQLPKGYSVDTEVTVSKVEKEVAPPSVEKEVSPPSCQLLFTTAMNNGTILFDTGSAELHPESMDFLDNLVTIIQSYSVGKIEIRGYADTDGSIANNLYLSQQRAEAVKNYLVNAGIEASLLIPMGYGEAYPIASNKTESGKAENRRVKFMVK